MACWRTRAGSTWSSIKFKSLTPAPDPLYPAQWGGYYFLLFFLEMLTRFSKDRAGLKRPLPDLLFKPLQMLSSAKPPMAVVQGHCTFSFASVKRTNVREPRAPSAISLWSQPWALWLVSHLRCPLGQSSSRKHEWLVPWTLRMPPSPDSPADSPSTKLLFQSPIPWPLQAAQSSVQMPETAEITGKTTAIKAACVMADSLCSPLSPAIAQVCTWQPHYLCALLSFQQPFSIAFIHSVLTKQLVRASAAL
jgi:hypothetical protein